jgi:hypothetical protein
MLRRVLILLCLLCAPACAYAQMGASLVPPGAADIYAVRDGSWQDPVTWSGGNVPQAGQKYYIPPGITVTNHAVTPDMLWGHVAGTQTFCDHCDTQLNVHTLYVAHTGKLRVHSTAKCVTEFVPGPFLPGDKTQVTRGLINHGEFMVSGVAKTAWGEVLEDLPVGATALKVAAATNWAAGDKLVITGTDSVLLGLDNSQNQHRYQSEFVAVESVAADGTVQFSPPLQYRHFRWRADLPFHVGNLTRNIVFRSRDASTTATRAHLMHMGSMMNDARWVAFEGLGRTTSLRPVTDWATDVWGEPLPGASDDNIRAKYADHYHKRGQLSQPVFREGCVCDGLNYLNKWNFLCHDSVAHWLNCISLRSNGSGFATEEGQERGSAVRCLSLLNRGMGDVIRSSDSDFSRPEAADFGISGDGFWLQGGMFDLRECVACDNSGRGVGIFCGPLNGWPRPYAGMPGYLAFPVEVSGTLLPAEYNGVASVPAGAVPQRVCDSVTAYMNKVSVQCWSSRPDDGSGKTIWPPTIRSSITNLKLWGCGNCLQLEYARQVTVNGVDIQGDSAVHLEGGYQWNTTNFDAPVALRGHHVTIRNLKISDYSRKGLYPHPIPIESVGDNGIDPDHVVESDYPINPVGYTRN